MFENSCSLNSMMEMIDQHSEEINQTKVLHAVYYGADLMEKDFHLSEEDSIGKDLAILALAYYELRNKYEFICSGCGKWSDRRSMNIMKDVKRNEYCSYSCYKKYDPYRTVEEVLEGE